MANKLYLLTTGIGQYVGEYKRKAIATDDPDRAKRFVSEDEAVDWANRHLGDRRFWVHECVPSYVRLPTT